MIFDSYLCINLMILQDGKAENALYKFFEGNPPSTEFQSAFTRKNRPDSLYLEARSPHTIINAFKNASSVIQPVRPQVTEDPVHLLTMADFTFEDQFIEGGDWVRPKSGLYYGDLALVIDIQCGQDATVLLVPRLSLITETSRKRKRSSMARQPPALFNTDAAKAQCGNQSVKERGCTLAFRNQLFYNGLLLSIFDSKKLEREIQIPRRHESESFTSAIEDMFRSREQQPAEMQRAIAKMMRNRCEARLQGNLSVGDCASMSGHNCPMRIAQLNNDSTANVELLNGSESIITVLIHDLRRNFKPGDGIQFITGKHIGLNVFVLMVENDLTGTVMMCDSPQVSGFHLVLFRTYFIDPAIQKYSSPKPCST